MKSVPARSRPDELPKFHSLTAADVMQRNLITVRLSDPLHEVERTLAEAQVSGVPVLDDDGKLAGLLSLSDVVARYAADRDLPGDDGMPRFGDDIDETEVVAFERDTDDQPCAGDLMTADVKTVPPDAPLREVARVMVQNRIHRVLVVDRGQVRGLISTLDLLGAVAE